MDGEFQASHGTGKQGRASLLLAGVLLFALAGCDQEDGRTITEPEATLSPEVEVARVVADHWDGLVTEERVEDDLTSSDRARTDPDVGLFLEWAAEARAAGEVGEARAALMEAAVRGLGEEVAQRSIQGVEAVLSALPERAVAGGTLGDLTDALLRARDLLATATAKLGQGEAAASLGASTHAAEVLAGLSPAKQAEEVVARARAMYQQAVAAVGPSPEANVARALEEAGRLLEDAVRHLQASQYPQAVRLARASMAISARLIHWASGGETAPTLQRVQAAIGEAEALLARAVAVAGDFPRPPVAQLLQGARSSLAEAKEALAAGDLRKALRAALQSSAYSLRILGGAGGSGAGPGAPAVEAAIADAEALLNRAAHLAGGNPAPPVSQWLAEARASLARAKAAFASGDYPAALAAARQAAAYARRVIHALGS